MKTPTGFVYIWINIQNNKKYIGSHMGKENDNYKGSGIHFVRAYNKEPVNFKREILEYCYGSKKDLHSLEREYLLAYDVQNNKDFYNLSNCAGGGENHSHLSEERRKEMYKRWNELGTQKLLNKSKEEKEIIKKKKQESWKTSPLLEKHSQQTRERRLREESQKTEKDKQQFSKSCKDAYWSREPEIIESHHKAQSAGVKKWHENKSPELEKQRRKRASKTKQKLQYKWINNSHKNIQVPFEKIERFLFNGWKRGMLKKSSSL